MDDINRMLPYLLIILLAFYTLPFLIIDTGSGMSILLFIFPVICFLVSIIYGIKEKFNFFYSILVAILFIPTIFIYYNDSAFVYCIIYGIISLISNYIGSMLKKS